MPNNDPTVYSGYATNFGGLYDQVRYQQAIAQGKSEKQALKVGDPGIGAPRLGTVSTANSYGVAVPTQYLREHLGNDPAAWRTARAELKIGDQTVIAPFVDIGPGKKQRAAGVVVDVTTPLSDAMGGFDKTKASVKIIPNAGPDYTTDQDEWYKEQAEIGKQFARPSVGAEPSPTPWAPLYADSDEDRKPNVLPSQFLASIAVDPRPLNRYSQNSE
jgi:hypothetical protein